VYIGIERSTRNDETSRIHTLSGSAGRTTTSPGLWTVTCCSAKTNRVPDLQLSVSIRLNQRVYCVEVGGITQQFNSRQLTIDSDSDSLDDRCERSSM